MRASHRIVTAATVALVAMAMMPAANAASEGTLARDGDTGSGKAVKAVEVSSTGSHAHIGVEVSLDGKSDRDEKFLYLKGDFGTAAGVDQPSLLADPDRSATSLSEHGLLGRFTPRYANLRLGFVKDRDGLGEGKAGLEVALTSSLSVDGGGSFDPLRVELLSSGYGERALNLGFSVGYAGFNLGATYLQGDAGLNTGYRGYDLGLGYQRGKWGTLLGFSGVSQSSETASFDIFSAESQYTMRVGAFYQLSPGLTLGGRFQFHDYRLFDSSDNQNRGEIFLNTNLNF